MSHVFISAAVLTVVVVVVFQLHLRSLSDDTEATAALQRLSARLEASWAELRASFDQSLCLLSYAKSALL